MKYKIEVSRPGHQDTIETQEATHLDAVISSVSEQHPDIEEWQQNIVTFPHGATGREWKPNGKGTDKIVVISPA